MTETLFTCADLEIRKEGDRYFAVYDAGAHQVVMRKDEITPEEALKACAGIESAMEVLFELQRRQTAAGIDPYVSNIDE